MPIVSILITLVVIGVLLWLVGMIPMDDAIHKIIRVLVLIATVLWLLSLFFNLGALGVLRIPTAR